YLAWIYRGNLRLDQRDRRISHYRSHAEDVQARNTRQGWREEEGELEVNIYIEFCYLAASILFVFGLKGLTHPDSARRGMLFAAAGMTAAIVGTLFNPEIVTYQWIWIGLLIGGAIGAAMSIWMPMTAMPERTALSHAFGALAAALVGAAEYANYGGNMGRLKVGALGFEIMLGCLTFTGSLIAFGKLYGAVKGTPITFKGQNIFN